MLYADMQAQRRWGNMIKFWCKENQMTQEDLADKLTLPNWILDSWIRGIRKADPKYLERIEEVTGIEPPDYLDREEKAPTITMEQVKQVIAEVNAEAEGTRQPMEKEKQEAEAVNRLQERLQSKPVEEDKVEQVFKEAHKEESKKEHNEANKEEKKNMDMMEWKAAFKKWDDAVTLSTKEKCKILKMSTWTLKRCGEGTDYHPSYAMQMNVKNATGILPFDKEPEPKEKKEKNTEVPKCDTKPKMETKETQEKFDTAQNPEAVVIPQKSDLEKKEVVMTLRQIKDILKYSEKGIITAEQGLNAFLKLQAGKTADDLEKEMSVEWIVAELLTRTLA